MIEYVSSIDQVVASTSGHAIRFEKGVPVSVPEDDVLLKDLAVHGCFPAANLNEATLAAMRADKREVDAEASEQAPAKGKK